MTIHRYDPEKIIDIREYCTSQFYRLEYDGLSRTLPIVPVDPSLWRVGNESLCFGCDVEYTEIASREMAKGLSPFCFDYIVCPEAKALSFIYEICRLLSIPRFIIIHKIPKKGIHFVLSEPMTSMTSPMPQILFLDDYSAKEIKGKKVVLLNDTITKGDTMNSLVNLMIKAQAEVEAIAAIWLEGPSYYQALSDFILTDRLVYLDYLPLYSIGEHYTFLLKQKERVARQHQTLVKMSQLVGSICPSNTLQKVQVFDSRLYNQV